MYLHLGNNVLVRKNSIIGIFDLDTVTWSKRTRDTLAMVEQAGQVENAAGAELPKSLVICSLGSGQRYLLSQLSPATLQRRSRMSGLEGL